jgi:hypothetical protein
VALEELREVDRVSEPRAAAEDPRRQAGPDGHSNGADRRRARPRHRHGRSRGNPADPVADRRQRAAGGRPRRGAVDPLGSHRGHPRRRADAARPRRRRARRRGRIIPEADVAAAAAGVAAVYSKDFD